MSKKHQPPRSAMIYTSCNRVQEVALAIAVNAVQIARPHVVIVADCSTPQLKFDAAYKLMRDGEPHINIDADTYSPWSDPFDFLRPELAALQIELCVVHLDWMPKQHGDAKLTSVGIDLARTLGCTAAAKLTGTCASRRDPLLLAEELVGSGIDFGILRRTQKIEHWSARCLLLNAARIAEQRVNHSAEWLGAGPWARCCFEERIRNAVMTSRLKVDETGMKDNAVLLDGGGHINPRMYSARLRDHLAKFPDAARQFAVIDQFLQNEGSSHDDGRTQGVLPDGDPRTAEARLPGGEHVPSPDVPES